MEVDGEAVVGGLQNLHLKHQLGGLGEEGLAQTLQAVGVPLLHQLGTLGKATALDGGATEITGIQPPLACLVAEEVKPGGAVLQLGADGLQKAVLILGIVLDVAHGVLLYIMKSLNEVAVL